MGPLLDVISEYRNCGLLALVVTVFATPVAALVGKRFGVLDRPDQKLKPHARPIPYLGGAAICLGWGAALIFALASSPMQIHWHLVLPILLGGIAMSALGLLDDLREVSPKLRLAVGALIILLVMLWTGEALSIRLVASALSASRVSQCPAFCTSCNAANSSLPRSLVVMNWCRAVPRALVINTAMPAATRSSTSVTPLWSLRCFIDLTSTLPGSGEPRRHAQR